VSSASVGAIQRSLLLLEQQGAERFFGEPALELADFLRTDTSGHGYINILAADQLVLRPRLYASFLLWLLSELFENLPEVGDAEKPRLVFFFDEAHLLFDDAPRALLDKVAQVVRLIRSKEVGIYFVTQNPADLPDVVLGQLGNRIQHALRGYTPKERKAIAAAAESFRPNPAFDTAETIGQLRVGEALVSTLGPDGAPGIVARTLIAPPAGRLGPLAPDERRRVIAASPHGGKYDRVFDRVSAYEMLQNRAAPTPASRPPQVAPRRERALPREDAPMERQRPPPRGNREGIGEALAKSVVRAVGSRIGQEIVRGVLGSILRGRR